MARENLEVELQARATAGVRAGDRERDGKRGGGHRRARLARALACAALLALLPGTRSGRAADPLPVTPPTVIVLSLDGVRHDYLDRAGVTLPAFARIAREGVRAARLVPVTPASTFPAHVSLATGAPVDRHGIVANRFLDPARGEFDYGADASWIDAEPLWIAAERQGVRSAVLFWVGSETDWRGQRATHRQTPFDSRLRERAKVAQILAWLDLPLEQRPRLVMSWWHGADEAGHRHGPDSPEVERALRSQDRELGRLLRGLDARAVWAYTTLLVVSDHGMAAVEESIDLAALLRAEKIRGRVVSAEGTAYLHLDVPGQAARLVEALRQVPGVRAYRAERVPRPLRLRVAGRSGQVVALTEPPRRFAARKRGLGRLLPGEPRGAHGYRGDHPDMGAIFLALGRGAPAGARLGPVRALDVAPTVAALLGIGPPLASEGRAQLPR